MSKNDIKYPHIEVQLTGDDDNAFAIVGAVKKALKANNVSNEELKEFETESFAGDYDHLVSTAQAWVTIN